MTEGREIGREGERKKWREREKEGKGGRQIEREERRENHIQRSGHPPSHTGQHVFPGPVLGRMLPLCRAAIAEETEVPRDNSLFICLLASFSSRPISGPCIRDHSSHLAVLFSLFY